MTDDFLTDTRRRMKRTTRIRAIRDAWAMLRGWRAVGRFANTRYELALIADLSGPPDPLTLGEMLAASGAVS